MKANTKKYLVYGGLAYAAYYWWTNYGPGKATPAQNAAANPSTANLVAAAGQQAIGAGNAIYDSIQRGM